MFVEDAVSAKGPIAVEVNPLSTVAELKLQVQLDLIPPEFWLKVLG